MQTPSWATISPPAPSRPLAEPDPLAALLAPLGRDVVRRVARASLQCAAPLSRALCSTREQTARAADLEIIEEELARLLAARELFMAWVQRAIHQEGHANFHPAQFLRAWSESTGRMIQLLKARRELGGNSAADALLDAVYAELEAELLRAGEPDAPEEHTP